MIFCIILPVVHVNVREARDEELELLFIEDRNQFCRNNIVKAWIK